VNAATLAAKGRSRRMPRGEREAVILDAAESVFGHSDFRTASMEAIAEQSGVTKALLYQYFGSKEGLYEQCMERGRARLFAELERRVNELEPGWQQLNVFVNGYFTYLDENRDLSWILYGEAPSAMIDKMRERNAHTVAGIFYPAAEAAGRIPSEDGIAVLAHGLIGAGEQVGRWWLNQRDVPKADVVASFLQLGRAMVASAFASMEVRSR
jgi:AcrR family transcriptional regulator